jgi:hypothetical protein
VPHKRTEKVLWGSRFGCLRRPLDNGRFAAAPQGPSPHVKRARKLMSGFVDGTSSATGTTFARSIVV